MIWEFAISQSYNYLLILLCVFISVLSYLKIFLMLRHYQNLAAQQQNGEPDGGGIPVNVARYTKTVATAISVQVTLIACYLPHSIVLAVIMNEKSSPIPDIICESAATLVCFKSSLNPLLCC